MMVSYLRLCKTRFKSLFWLDLYIRNGKGWEASNQSQRMIKEEQSYGAQVIGVKLTERMTDPTATDFYSSTNTYYFLLQYLCTYTIILSIPIRTIQQIRLQTTMKDSKIDRSKISIVLMQLLSFRSTSLWQF